MSLRRAPAGRATLPARDEPAGSVALAAARARPFQLWHALTLRAHRVAPPPAACPGRYDLVVHLVTAADGALPFYTTSNNAARTESAEEAVRLDRAVEQCYKAHPRQVVVGNEAGFDVKVRVARLGVAHELRLPRGSRSASRPPARTARSLDPRYFLRACCPGARAARASRRGHWQRRVAAGRQSVTRNACSRRAFSAAELQQHVIRHAVRRRACQALPAPDARTMAAAAASTARKVCVTGASGFIASHLTAMLLERGYTVSAGSAARRDPAPDGAAAEPSIRGSQPPPARPHARSSRPNLVQSVDNADWRQRGLRGAPPLARPWRRRKCRPCHGHRLHLALLQLAAVTPPPPRGPPDRPRHPRPP